MPPRILGPCTGHFIALGKELVFEYSRSLTLRCLEKSTSCARKITNHFGLMLSRFNQLNYTAIGTSAHSQNSSIFQPNDGRGAHSQPLDQLFERKAEEYQDPSDLSK